MDSIKDALKNKLWAAIDQLYDEDGFVLVAAGKEIQFTRITATDGYDSAAVLELAPLRIAEEWQEKERLVRENRVLVEKRDRLTAEVEQLERRKADVDAALGNALGRKP